MLYIVDVAIAFSFVVGIYDVILLDVDSKDMSTGMSSPPQQFLQRDFLGSLKLLLKPSGYY